MSRVAPAESRSGRGGWRPRKEQARAGRGGEGRGEKSIKQICKQGRPSPRCSGGTRFLFLEDGKDEVIWKDTGWGRAPGGGGARDPVSRGMARPWGCGRSSAGQRRSAQS